MSKKPPDPTPKFYSNLALVLNPGFISRRASRVSFRLGTYRTKMFHVKHFCPIGPENLTKLMGELS